MSITMALLAIKSKCIEKDKEYVIFPRID
jgi:hypothetical protein